MLVQDLLDDRLTSTSGREAREAGSIRLPQTLKRDSASARIGLLQRLAASRLFAHGNRSGVLKSAQTRSGRSFRLDVRQSVIVKAMVSRHAGRGAERAAGLIRHMSYLGRHGAGQEGARPEFFDRDQDGLDPTVCATDWATDRHHFRLIISPEHGDRIADLRDYVRAVMARVCEDLGQRSLAWVATCHFDTEKPHAHVVVRGRKDNGKDLVIPRDYIAYGIRGRAQEVAQERLGDLSRVDAERRVWSQTAADRFTGLDRRLLEAADPDGRVTDGVGTGAWQALSRGRLRHLEGLRLAAPITGGYRLSRELELRLRRLQFDKDMIRTMHARRLFGVRDIRSLTAQPVNGRVVSSGHHDELGAAPFVVVRDEAGTEFYARLNARGPGLQIGDQVQLNPTAAGRVLVRPLPRGLGSEL
jgi:type IV secretory pathway VirD2 relaxase